MTQPVSCFYYPNKMGQILLRGMEEILGQTGINAVLNQSAHPYLINNYPPNNLERQFKFSDISKINATLEEIYGVRGGQGLAIRSGRACFKYGLREFVPDSGSANLEFRLLPLNYKILQGANLLAGLFNTYSDQRVQVEDKENYILWHTQHCPICWQRRADRPACHLMVGTFQEALFWLSGGKYFIVEEILCIARGDSTCTFRIDKSPLE
jgi:predicted hydrocarbon binding protein